MTDPATAMGSAVVGLDRYGEKGWSSGLNTCG